jgi:hypothetical protein
MEFFRIKKEKLLPILVNRTAIFFFLMCLLALFLYAAGTVQGFIDAAQLNLLRLYTVLGIFLMISSVCGLILDLRRSLKSRRAGYLLRAAGYVFLAIFAAATVMAVFFIIALSEGNGG